MKQQVNSKYTISDLRNVIPAHCFKPSMRLSFWYLFRDFIVAGAMMTIAFIYIPMIETQLTRYASWAAYGYLQGQQMTGIWVCWLCFLLHPVSTESISRSLDTNVGMVHFRHTRCSMTLLAGFCIPLS